MKLSALNDLNCECGITKYVTSYKRSIRLLLVSSLKPRLSERANRMV